MQTLDLTTHTPCNLCGANRTEEIMEKNGYHVVECLRCGLVYVNPRPSRRALRERYDEDYFSTEFQTGASFVASEPQRVTESLYHDALDTAERELGHKGSLLDVGCGVGSFMAFARKRGWGVSGIDVSPFAASYVSDRLDMEVFNGDLQEAEFQNRSFDLVSMWSVIEHLPNPREHMLEVRRILKEGGMVITSTVNYRGLTTSLLGKESQVVDPSQHIYYFTPRTMSTLLEESGFSVTRLETRNLYLHNIVSTWTKLWGWSNTDERTTKRYRAIYRFAQNNLLSLALIRATNLLLNAMKIGDTLIAHGMTRV